MFWIQGETLALLLMKQRQKKEKKRPTNQRLWVGYVFAGDHYGLRAFRWQEY